MRTVLAVLPLLAAVALAGCSGGGGGDGPSAGSGTTGPLEAGKGAIAGLVINDVYRPVPGALVLLQPTGLTATSDASGQFAFLDLEPGAYLLRVQAEGHEASPASVDVAEGEYAESEVIARRVVNEAGRIITVQYSVFVTCWADFVVNFVVGDCTNDQSGDTDRASFNSNYTDVADITYIVVEMKANKVGNYNIQMREDDGSAAGGDRYAVAEIEATDYVKIVIQKGVANSEHNAQDNNVPWENDREFTTILFPKGEFREEVTSNDPSGTTCCGVGAGVGVQAQFVQSVFVGAPEVDLASYCTLC